MMWFGLVWFGARMLWRFGLLVQGVGKSWNGLKTRVSCVALFFNQTTVVVTGKRFRWVLHELRVVCGYSNDI